MRGYYFIQEVKECEFTMPRTICVYNIMINYLNFIFLKSSTSLFYCFAQVDTLLVLICLVETCPFLKKEASFYRATLNMGKLWRGG